MSVWQLASLLAVVEFVAAFSFDFPPGIDQCASIDLPLHGKPNATDLPLSFAVLPFNSTFPLTIAIPNDTIDTTAVWISFLPYPAGTSFIATFLASSNLTEGAVTNVTQILPSPSGNWTCLPSSSSSSTPLFYTLQGPFAQCASFNVTFDPITISQPPTIRAFTPLGSSVWINMTAEPEPGVATYTNSANHGDNVVLLLDDLQGHRQTTSLLSVGGNSSSNTCLPFTVLPSSQPPMPQNLSKGTVAAIAGSASGIVTFVFLLIVIYAIRDRRRRNVSQFSGSLTRIKDFGTAPPPRPSRNAIPPLFSVPTTTNPPYTQYSYAADKAKDPMQETPQRPTSPFRFALDLSRPHPPSPVVPSSALNSPHGNASFTSADIENILNSATFFQDRPSPLDHRYRPSDISLPRSVHLAVPNDPGSMVSRPSRRTHQRDPSDVPAEAGRGGSFQVPYGVGPERFSFWSGLSEEGTVQDGSPSAPRNSVVSQEMDPSWYGVAQ